MSLFGVGKRIVKGQTQPILHRLIAEYGNRMPQIELEQTEIVKTHDVVRMLVGVDNRMNDSDFFS